MATRIYRTDTTSSINVRLEADERERIEQLAGSAGISISEAVRALIRSAEQITPARPATAVFPGVPVSRMEGKAKSMTKTLQQVMAEYPELTAWGFVIQTDLETDRKTLADSESDFEYCVQWIDANVRPSNRFDYSLYRTSYGLKHTAETNSPRKYLCNGTFIAAWIALGNRHWKRIADTPSIRVALCRSDEKAIEGGKRRKTR